MRLSVKSRTPKAEVRRPAVGQLAEIDHVLDAVLAVHTAAGAANGTPAPLAPMAAQERGPPAWGAAVSEAQRKMTVKPALIHVAV